MRLDEVAYAKAGSVAEITLDRPAQRNPISARPGGTRDQILWALDDAVGDPHIGCILLRGAGPAFSAGGDLTGNVRRETIEEHRHFLEEADAFHQRVREVPLPVVAAVHGVCLGAALQLVSLLRLRGRGGETRGSVCPRAASVSSAARRSSRSWGASGRSSSSSPAS